MPIPAALVSALPGRFVVFDGPDGSGKSTQLARFVAAADRAGVDILSVREPGHTEVGQEIRELLLRPRREPVSPACETLLFMASRAQLVSREIRPALAAGRCVLADRYVSSTLAYQGTAGGIDERHIRAVADLACDSVWPDLTVIFDVDEATAARRLSPLLDRMEAKGSAFHARVRQGYLDQARRDPDRYAVIDARPDEDTVAAELLRVLQARLAR